VDIVRGRVRKESEILLDEGKGGRRHFVELCQGRKGCVKLGDESEGWKISRISQPQKEEAFLMTRGTQESDGLGF